MTPFEALGIPPAFALDLDAVRKRMLALTRALHPDFHSTASAGDRLRAENNTAGLNAAFQVLADDARRADCLVQLLAGPSEEEERSMPAEFLAEVMECDETLAAARAAPPDSAARGALTELGARLERERASEMRALASLLTPLPAPGAPALRAARQRLSALRYLDRLLAELGELRLATDS